MGVTILQQYPVKDKTGPQTIELLSKRITALGAKQTGQFIVDCETHVASSPQMGGTQRTVHVLHNSEQPASVFSILDTGTKTIPVVADTLFDFLIVKLNTVLVKRQRIETRGPRYELCDFCIKIGSVTMGQNFKGVLLEVEYKPSVIPGSCWDFMKEFIQGFLGNTALNIVPQYLQNRMDQVYQPIDTIQQYLEHFNMFRKTTGILQYQ
ncbi:mediator of RNA polymerase II transcription subunit 20 [Planococcus citri]|uniref:mediator of RNA polymerase II transcription subunit 20 n=1 Tax=Planococcus citri TaxID=170843 RepID=UPI0031F8A47B